MTDAFVSTTLDGKITESNRSYQELLGYTKEELLELTYIDLTPEKWHAMEERILKEQIMPHGHSVVYEKEYRRKDGSIVPVELRTFLLDDDDGNPVAMWAIIRDISRHKQLEAALKESNEHLEERVSEQTAELRKSELRLQQFADASIEGIALLHDGVIIDANTQLATMLRCEPSTLIGKPAVTFAAPHSRDLSHQNIHSTEESCYQFDARRQDGTEFPAEVRGKTLSLGDLQVRVSVLRDLTEQRRFEAEVKTRGRNLVRAHEMLMLSEVGAGIVHQIAQPLCAVSNNVAAAKQAASQCDNPTCVTKRLICDVDEDIKRMRTITDRLRRLAHPEGTERKPVQLNDLLTEVLHLIPCPDGPKSIEIIRQFQKDLPLTMLDAMQISQMILNLVWNAIDALTNDSAAGGQITITTRTLTPDRVELSIADTGPGIPPDVLPQIFELFFTTKQTGTGIGLALSRRIVAAHGGSLQTENNLDGPGVTFRVLLPCEEGQS